MPSEFVTSILAEWKWGGSGDDAERRNSKHFIFSHCIQFDHLTTFFTFHKSRFRLPYPTCSYIFLSSTCLTSHHWISQKNPRYSSRLYQHQKHEHTPESLPQEGQFQPINSYNLPSNSIACLLNGPIMATHRRILRELDDMAKDKASGMQATVVDASDLTHLEGSFLGPPGTPYEGGRYLIDITLPPNYPFLPPKMYFKTKVWHPNISSQTVRASRSPIESELITSLREPFVLIPFRKNGHQSSPLRLRY